MLELFDTHVHLDAEAFDDDREAVIDRARAAGVTRFVTIGAGYGADSAGRAVALAEKYDCIWATVGIHPHDAASPVDVDKLQSLAQHPRVVAIGETGFDFFKEFAPRADQERWFRIHVQLSRDLRKPLVIHSRDSGEETLRVLKEEKAESGVFHCYPEDARFAARLRDMNFLISVPGIITFKKSEALRATLREIPLSQIMLETDAPYLAPEPYRGKRCESSFMVETARAIATLKGISIEEVAHSTTQTALRFFSIGG